MPFATKELNPVSPAQAVALMAVLETAIESSTSGEALPLPSQRLSRPHGTSRLARRLATGKMPDSKA